MKSTSRLIALLLALVMAAGMFASCANNEDDKPTVVDPNKQQEEQGDTPVFAEEDFGGDTFTIIAYDESATDFIDNYIDNEEQTGEPINDAVIDRNTAVEEKYNVDVVKRGVSSPKSVASSAAKSGTVDFDLVYEWGIRLVPMVTEGLCYDFLQIPNIDLTQDYWAPSAQGDLTIADKMLISTNDISMNRIAWAYFLFFNAAMCDRLKLEMPYTYVDQNNWTYDTFLSMVSAAAQDNGDTLWTNDDQYGFFGTSDDCMKFFANSAGILGTSKNEDGTYQVTLLNDKLQQIYTKYYKKMATDPAFPNLDIGGWTDGRDTSAWESIYKAYRYCAFGEGHCLFASFSMDMTHELTEMPEDYGVVPSPKYDSAQTEYFHVIDTCAPMFSVPKQAADMDKIGIILEYMAYESQQRLLPAFYEQTIKVKRMNDLQGRDEKMLDIVRDSGHYSWTGLYYLAMKDVKGDPWDPCGSTISDMLVSGQFASVYKSKAALIESEINNLYDLILDMDVNK